MNTTIGTAQYPINGSTAASVSLQRLYYTRFVSPPLSGISSVTAQTWTYNFAALETSTNANYPVSGISQIVRCMAYVWRPSNQTKVGNILDGNSAATVREGSANTEISNNTTFTGSLVSSVSDGDVICFEVWFEVTQATAAGNNCYFFYDGTTVTSTSGTTVSNHASFIETPQNLTFGTEVLDTRLYFHAANSVLSNLPTTEQSSLTASVTVDAVTVNRNMNTTIGTSQTSLAATTLAQTAQQSIYFTRFVSDALSGVSSIPAGLWAYDFAASESNVSANFPTSGVAGAGVRCTCYVWRPSNQTKLGIIYEGASTNAIEGAASTEVAEHVEFTGSAVASVVDGDVVIFEVWIQPTQAAATSYTDTFFYDGTTVTIGNFLAATTVSNHASFLDCSDALTFAGAGPVDCTVTGKTLYNKTTTHG